MPHKEFLIQKCTAVGASWLAYSSIALSPSFISIAIQGIIGVFVVSAMLTTIKTAVKDKYNDDWNIWFKSVHKDSWIMGYIREKFKNFIEEALG